MEMTVAAIIKPWAVIDAALGLSTPIQSEKHYNELLAFVEECFERFGEDEHHPVFALVDLVADRIREYEDRVHPWLDTSTPATRLAFLMDQHGLKQTDLREIGTQGVVSEVLAGKRTLNLRQAKALAARFSVSIDAIAG
jgi:HTH-type transcriptional regulator/antitoxin HigA